MSKQNADYETCEDRDYTCCEAMPPPANPNPDEYQAWYDAHVANWFTS